MLYPYNINHNISAHTVGEYDTILVILYLKTVYKIIQVLDSHLNFKLQMDLVVVFAVFILAVVLIWFMSHQCCFKKM